MPHHDRSRHRRGGPRRPVEHRVSGGYHRNREGCLSAVVAILAIPVTLALSAAYIAGQIVRSFI